VLCAATIVALILGNSALGPLYETLLDWPVSVQLDGLIIARPLLLWVNDGLMAGFYSLRTRG
jgi:NhaA family Na+:H+ antiporter